MSRMAVLIRLRQGIRTSLRLRPSRVLAAIGPVFCLLVIAGAVEIAVSDRNEALQHAGANLANLSLALADQTGGKIASLEVAEERLVDHLVLDSDDLSDSRLTIDGSKRLHDLLLDITSGMPDAYELALVDADGMLVNLSVAYPTPNRNLADREYFHFAKAHPNIRTFISEPVYSRQTGLPTFYVVRRLNSPDGSFRGVLLAGIGTSYLTHRFQALKLAQGATISLLRRDGTMLVREPSLPLENFRAHRDELRALAESVGEGGIKRLVGVDGVERFTSFAVLHQYDLLLAISEPYASILSAWRSELVWLVLVALLICWVIGITIFLAMRGFRNQQRLEAMEATRQVDAERLRAERAFAEQNAWFALAVDTMGHGLMMFSRSKHLIFSNAAIDKIFEVPEQTLQPGMELLDIIEILTNVGIVVEPVEDTLKRYSEILRQEVPVKYVRNLPDGRQLAVCFMPHADGGLFTFEDVTELRRADARIAHMAHHDTLTGLPNRLELRLREENALKNVEAEPFALMWLDLDHFKNVNDTLGHPAGDRLLQEVAARIHAIIRGSDTVARLGGDEFAIMVQPFKDRNGIAHLADRLIEAINQPFVIDGQTTFISGSIGIAVAPNDSRDPDLLMKQADLALYRAKNDGRGRYAFFEASMEQRAAEHRRIEAEMHEALAQQQFKLHYQPLISALTRRVIGFEALLRWQHPERGMIPPASFIPIGEENGMIVQIGAWVLQTACQTASEWSSDLKVAVNLSPVQFLDGALVDTVSTALMTSGLAPSRLELEITESTMMHDIDVALATLMKLKELGVSIAMDDFGTGYSSLAHLQRFPFDKVKIDQAFVRNIAHSHNIAILRAIAHIAQSMGIRTTAEGVETEAQLASVVAVGCDELQGYLFSAPLPADKLLLAKARIDGLAPETNIVANLPPAHICRLSEDCDLHTSATSSPCGQVSCPYTISVALLGEVV